MFLGCFLYVATLSVLSVLLCKRVVLSLASRIVTLSEIKRCDMKNKIMHHLKQTTQQIFDLIISVNKRLSMGKKLGIGKI